MIHVTYIGGNHPIPLNAMTLPSHILTPNIPECFPAPQPTPATIPQAPAYLSIC